MTPQQTRWLIVFFFLVLCGSSFFAPPIPPIRMGRAENDLRGCFANMRVLSGAIEMYNMDHTPMMDQNPVTCAFPMEPLYEGASPYLRSPVRCPRDGQYLAGPEKLTETGQLFCTIHGYLQDYDEQPRPLREEFTLRCTRAGLDPANFQADLDHYDPQRGGQQFFSGSFSRWFFTSITPGMLILYLLLLPLMLIAVDRVLTPFYLFSAISISVGLCLSSTFIIFSNLLASVGFTAYSSLLFFELVTVVAGFWWFACGAITVVCFFTGRTNPAPSLLFLVSGIPLLAIITAGGTAVIPFFGLAYTLHAIWSLFQNPSRPLQ